MKKKRIGVLSLGCPRNLVDSESILGRLSLKGYKITDMKDAEIGIINTCSFVEEAKRESIDAILGLIDLKKEGRLKKIIVCGCLPQRYKDELRRNLKEVDAFIGKVSLNHSNARFSLTPRHFAYVKICEGCLHGCSFCVIPKIKGEFVSRDMDSVVSEVKRHDANGVREINIVGQDISSFGRGLGRKANLAGLLKEILKNTRNIRWIRLLYLYPKHIDDKLLALINEEQRVCKYVDLPIQHINERILKRMNRQTTKKDILQLLKKVRKAIPGVGLRTSLIVGFPGETDKEFAELLDFIQEARFERLGVFTYSREEGTAAYNFKNQVPARIKDERLNIIMSKQQEISRLHNSKFLGRVIEVLIDELDEAGLYLGRSALDAPEVDGIVYVKSPARKLKPGDFVKVKITDTLEYDLTGEAV